jgi:acyl-coenzyme A synthetase/AMP-(fatty) acid ligase
MPQRRATEDLGLWSLPPAWISTPLMRPDHRGPVDRPYRPLADPAQASPMLLTLQAVAAARPDEVAIEDASGSVTFGGLMRAISALAARIAQAPPGPVAVLLAAGGDYAIAVFASLAASRLCVLLDASYPDERNAAVAAATGVSVAVIGQGQAAPAWPGVSAVHAQQAQTTVPEPLISFMDLDEPAFVLCTSGSSGLPKAIVHTQRTMLHWARTTHEALHVTPSDRVLTLSSLSTLGGFTALLSYPLAGAAIQMLDVKTAGLGRLIAVLRDRPVSILRATPSLLRSLVGMPGARAAFGRLRVVQTYGEPLMKADCASIRGVLPADCLVRSTYGSTEASGLSWFVRADDDDYDPFRAPAGTLMPDTEASIRDAEGAPCRFGEPGELWIRSRYNAIGEWRDGAVSRGPFEPDPHDSASRIFRTGDMAVAHPDGVFVVLGRLDRMAKINGQRLEPAEVEAALRRCPDVARAAVVVRHRGGKAAALIAFVVAGAGSTPELAAELRAMLRGELPGFMVPSRILLVPDIPLLPGGKVDEAELVAIAERRQVPEGSTMIAGR